jgi:hypothetical protein
MHLHIRIMDIDKSSPMECNLWVIRGLCYAMCDAREPFQQIALLSSPTASLSASVPRHSTYYYSKTLEPPANLMSVHHLWTEVRYVCSMDFTMVFGDNNVLKKCSHRSPASMPPGCTVMRFKPWTLAMSTRFAHPVSTQGKISLQNSKWRVHGMNYII